jgi:protein-L-isoaspartate(D-aspartate) O-methyltransferase
MADMNSDRPYDPASDPYRAERAAMVANQIEARSISDPAVLAAFRRVPRHEFVPAFQRESAYQDSALPIGHGQTISQPYIVALMTSLAQPLAGAKILEIGAGSGYQAAILAELGATVYSLEIVEFQVQRSRETLQRLGYADRVQVIAGDGFLGYPPAAPFDVILVTCAVSDIPRPWLDQLAPSGRIILPLGNDLAYQSLSVVTRKADGGLSTRHITGVVFVPMTGPHGFKGD